MTHRGRNNLLVLLLGLKPEIMFGKMSGVPEFPNDAEHARIIGDVLSHLQVSTKMANGKDVSLLPNPSHLDAINPAAMGKARSKIENGKKALCIQCHGDGSLIGQGIYRYKSYSSVGAQGVVFVICLKVLSRFLVRDNCKGKYQSIYIFFNFDFQTILNRVLMIMQYRSF